MLGGCDSDDDMIIKPVDDVPLETLTKAMQDSAGNVHLKNVGAGADEASVNFGCKRGLIQIYKENVADWIVRSDDLFWSFH